MKKLLPKLKKLLEKPRLKATTMAAVITAITFFAANGQDSIVPVSNVTGGFEIDGGLKADTPTPGAGDWLQGTGSGGYVFDNNGDPVDTLNSFRVIDSYSGDGTTDTIFSGGSKFNQPPSAWSWSTGSASGKTEINNVMFHYGTDADNNQWVFISGDRESTDGVSYIDFEFLQDSVALEPGGGFYSTGTDGGRTSGDFVLSMDYSNGGTNPVVSYWVWSEVSPGVWDYADSTGTVDPGVFYVETNLVTEDVPYGAFGLNTYDPLQFIEAAANVTGLIGDADPCASISIKTIIVKTKASNAKTAALKDLVSPINVELQFGTAEISYNDGLPICSYEGSATVTQTGVPGGTYSISLLSGDGGATIDPNDGTISFAKADTGTYRVTYTYSTNGCEKTTFTDVVIEACCVLEDVDIEADQTICYGTSPTLTSVVTPTSGVNPYTYQWQMWNDMEWTDISGATSDTYTPEPGLTQTTQYRLLVGEGEACDTLVSDTVTITVTPEFTASISSDQDICYNTQPAELTSSVSGGSGNYSYQWWTAESDGTPIDTITNATDATYQPPALTDTTYYILQVGDDICDTILTNHVTINVTEDFTASIESDQLIGYDTQPELLTSTVTGGSGVYSYQWWTADETGEPVAEISGADSATYQPPVLQDTTYYILQVGDELCDTILTNYVTINVTDQFIASISADQDICYNTIPEELTSQVSGGSGNYSYQWWTADENGDPVDEISGAVSDTYQPPALTDTTYYILQVGDEVADTILTNYITIRVTPEFTASISEDQDICYNTEPALLTSTISGGSGEYAYQWWTADAMGNPVAEISGEESATYQPPVLMDTAYYILQVGDDICDTILTNHVTINVTEDFTASISADQDICYDSQPELLTSTVSGGSDTHYYQWWTADENGTPLTEISGAESATYQPPALTDTAYYILQVGDDICDTILTNFVTINVTEEFTASISTDQKICGGDVPDALTSTVSGGSGIYNYQWWTAQEDGTPIAEIEGATGSAYQPPALVDTTYYVLQVTDDVCGSTVTEPVAIYTPEAPISCNIIVDDHVTCYNGNDGKATVQVTGGWGNYTYSWNDRFLQKTATAENLEARAYTVTVTDGEGCSTTCTVVINEPPAFTCEITLDKKISFVGADDGIATVNVTGGVGDLTYLWSNGATTATVTDLEAGYHSVTVTDETGCETQCEITLTEENNPPVARNDINTTQVDIPVSGWVMTNDYDPDHDEMMVNPTPVISPSNGTVSLNEDGSYTYTPDAGFTGKDHFDYQLCDTTGLCDTATVSISVFAKPHGNRPPVAVEDNVVGKMNTPVFGYLTANDFDPDKDNIAINVTPVTSPASGSVTINSDGSFNFVPATDFTGIVTFEYEICDDGDPSLCDTTLVTIDIREVPVETNTTVGVDDAYFAEMDEIVSGDVSDNDYDPENDLQVSFEVIHDPTNGTVALNSDGTFEYTPGQGFVGNDQFVYEVCDNGTEVACDRATVYFVIEETNEPPVAENDTLTITDCMEVTIDVLQNDSDPDGDELTMPVIITDVNAGELTANENGTFTYLPEAGFEGTVTFTYEICDVKDDPDLQLCDQAEVVINIIQPDEVLSCTAEETLPVSVEANDGEATATATGGWGNYSYEWSDGQTTATATGLSPGDYSVVVIDDEGCITECEVTIDEYEPVEPPEPPVVPCEFLIPEGFSPNGDTYNDYFEIRCIEEYPNAEIQIYNRWGNLIFEQDNYNNPANWWDGRSNQKGTFGDEILPTGTYFYILHLNDGSDPIKGSVFLNR